MPDRTARDPALDALATAGVAALRVDALGRVAGATPALAALAAAEVLPGMQVLACGVDRWPPAAGATHELDLGAGPIRVVWTPDDRGTLGVAARVAVGDARDDPALEALSRVSRDLVGRDLPGEVDVALARAACEATGASGATVFAEHPDGGLVVTHADGWNRTGARVLPGAHSGANLVHRTGLPLFAPDAQRDPRLSAGNLRQSSAASVAIWPVRIDDRTAGAVLCWWAEPVAGLSPRQEGQLGLVADAAAVAIERRSLHGRLELSTRVDPTTGLGNRRALDAELSRRIASDAADGIGLGVLALDDLRAYNDRHGYAGGDELLCACAASWTAELGPADVLVRMGGDRFAVLLAGRDEAEAVRVVDALRRLVPAAVGCSAGVAAWDGSEPGDALVERALAALGRARAQGGDLACVAKRRAWAHPRAGGGARVEVRRDGPVPVPELRRALAQGRFELHHQPLVSARTGDLVGTEALLRLRDVGGELVAPGRFIGVAEATGLIVGLGAWVIEEACAHLAAWRDAGLATHPVSLNLSPRQLEGPDVAGVLLASIRRHGLAPSDVCVEVTESALSGTEELVALLGRLRELGVRTALDDFGAGHSSLSRLIELPLDVVKVDRAIAARVGTDLRAPALLQGVVALARSLGLRTAVEGIETPAQREACRRAGADLLQGYLLGRPEPAAALAGRLEPAVARVS